MAHLQKVEETDLITRVTAYNSRCRKDSERVQLTSSIGVEEQAWVCRGPLRLYWDVSVQLSLVESDGSKPLNRHYYDRSASVFGGAADKAADTAADDGGSVEVFDGVRLRRRTPKQRQVIPLDWRRSINGHAFTGPSCVQPDAGQCVTVLADINDTMHQVLSALFSKFLIRDDPDRFCLVVLAPDGWELTLSQLDCPLRVRLSLGPDEATTGKLLIREVGRPSPRASILELAGLPTPLLRQLLASIDEEESVEVALTQKRFSTARSTIEAALRRLQKGGQIGGRPDWVDDDFAERTAGGDMSHL